MSETTSDPAELSFEAAYERLQAIATRLSQDEVPVSEMCDLFAEGRGLELACTEFLDTERGRVEAIERGEGVRAFRITRGSTSASSPPGTDTAIETSDFTSGSTLKRPQSAPSVASGAADEIPF